MSGLRTIEIDFEIHKLIEQERRGFDEPPYVALRRLLRLPAAAAVPVTAVAKAGTKGGRPWRGEGVTLPHRTLVRMVYNGRTHDGEIVDGQWAVEGNTYGSPSGAASGVAVTKKGKKTKLDGWVYWSAKLPDSPEYVTLADLHRQANPKHTLESLGLLP